MSKILLVEDDDSTADYISNGLSEAGFVVDRVDNGRDGLFQATDGGYDCIILDRMLPGLDGLSLLETLRARDCDTPVIILSAIGSTDERVRGLRAGSDDYLVKPFSMPEFMARVKALLRRAKPEVLSSVLKVGDVVLDREQHRVYRKKSEIKLGPTEFRLLEFMMRHPGRVFSRTQLLDNVWGETIYIDERTVDVHVGRLRKAVNNDRMPDVIRTIRGSGYAIRED